MSKLGDDILNPPALTPGGEGIVVTPDGLKVLVVDDDEMMRRLVGRALTAFGFTKIHVAEDGAEGLAAAERDAPDIIICDYMMPGMHGLEFVEAVRGKSDLDHAVIIMLSAADDHVVIETAQGIGADSFVVKPFERAELKNIIGILFERYNCARIQWPE